MDLIHGRMSLPPLFFAAASNFLETPVIGNKKENIKNYVQNENININN